MDQDEQKNDVITLVLTADNHLGYTVAGQNQRKREELRQRLRRAFQQATDFAIGQGVDLFVQAGDLFDTTHPDEQDRSFVATRLAELKQAGIRAFALGGLHDTPLESRGQRGDAFPAPQMSFARLGALHYFPPLRGDERENPQETAVTATLRPVLLDVRGTQVGICGLSMVAGQQGDPLANVRVEGEIERAAIPLLLLSAPVEGVASNGVPAQVSRATIQSQAAFRTVLAGYTHRYQRLTIGQADVVIAGATQHVEFGETDDTPGFVFLGIAADGIRWCRHIDIDSIQMQCLVIPVAGLWPEGENAENVDVAEVAPATSPTERILEQLRPLCEDDTVVQLRLEGELSRQQYHQLDLGSLRRYGEAHTFAFLLDDSALTFSLDNAAHEPSSTVPHAADFEERLSPREELMALADEWIAGAQDEQEQNALLATKEELLAALWSTAKA